MAKSDMDRHLARIDALVSDMKHFVPDGTPGATGFLADLAGLLVVAIAATYENCVKEVLTLYAARRHSDFEQFVSKNYAKISSKIAEDDLLRYAKLFGDPIHAKFKSLLQEKSKAIHEKTGQNFKSMYKQILEWRHEYAHSGIRNTTISEAARFHLFAKRMIYCFEKAFR